MVLPLFPGLPFRHGHQGGDGERTRSSSFLYDRTFTPGLFRRPGRQRGRCYLGLGRDVGSAPALLVASAGWNRGGTSGLAVGFSPWAYWLTQFEAVYPLSLAFGLAHPLVFEYGTFHLGHGGGGGAVYRRGYLTRGGRRICPSSRSGCKPPVGPAARPPAWPTTAHLRFFSGPGFPRSWPRPPLVPGAPSQMIAVNIACLALAPIMVVAVSRPFRPGCRIALVACLAAALGFGLITAQRVGDYRTELALWTDTVGEARPTTRARIIISARPCNAPDRMTEAGSGSRRARPPLPLARRRSSVQSRRHLPPASRASRGGGGQLREALRLRPDFAEAHEVMAGVLLQQGDVHDALQDYAEALRLAPDSFASLQFRQRPFRAEPAGGGGRAIPSGVDDPTRLHRNPL